MGLLEISSVFNDKNNDKDFVVFYREKIEKLEREFTFLKKKNSNIVESLKKYKEDNKILTEHLNIDAKTGLPNKIKLTNDLPKILNIDEYQKTGKCIAVLIIQLNKTYNVLTKTLHPAIIEWILLKIGMNIRKIVYPHLVYHTKENEFIVILRNIQDSGSAERYAYRITNRIKKIENISGYHIYIKANIGIAMFPEHGITKEQIMNAADIAVEYSKKGNTDYVFYKNYFKHKELEKLELQNYMIKAIEKNSMSTMDQQFVMYYQPVVRIESGKNGKLKIVKIGAEALIRWIHPEKGMISPSKFIPISEETGIIVLLGNWIIYRVADMMVHWKEKYGMQIPVFVNISSLQFHEENLAGFLKHVIVSKRIDPRMLTVEMTETSLMIDPVETLEKIMTLREAGIKFSIDDFGTGYSSFNYLREFSINILKIDKCFIDDIFYNQCDQAIIRAIFTMSKELKFDIIAEGVENINQFHFLYGEGCRNFQGFLFGKPLPADNFIDFYKENLNKEIF